MTPKQISRLNRITGRIEGIASGCDGSIKSALECTAKSLECVLTEDTVSKTIAVVRCRDCAAWKDFRVCTLLGQCEDGTIEIETSGSFYCAYGTRAKDVDKEEHDA